ncbi:NUDIX hydrolase [soil metagenome]
MTQADDSNSAADDKARATALLAADDAHLREVCVESKEVYRGHFLEVRRDMVELPDGKITSREYIVHPGAVMIVPILADGSLVVERQYRYPLHRAFLEFPAGKIDKGEPPWECGIRELAEETGYHATEWARACVINNAIAYSTEGIEIWFARGLTAGAQGLDSGEFLDVSTSTLEEMEGMAGRGELTDVKTLVGLMWLRKWREGSWNLDWRPAP